MHIFNLKPIIYIGDSQVTQCKESTCQCKRCRQCRFDPWSRKIPLEEEIATHSSILAWEVPWTEEPGGLESMGS